MPKTSAFALQLREARVESGLSQAQLAEKVWPRSASAGTFARGSRLISAYENDRRKPSPALAAKLAKALGRDPRYFASALAEDHLASFCKPQEMTRVVVGPVGLLHMFVDRLVVEGVIPADRAEDAKRDVPLVVQDHRATSWVAIRGTKSTQR